MFRNISIIEFPLGVPRKENEVAILLASLMCVLHYPAESISGLSRLEQAEKYWPFVFSGGRTPVSQLTAMTHALLVYMEISQSGPETPWDYLPHKLALMLLQATPAPGTTSACIRHYHHLVCPWSYSLHVPETILNVLLIRLTLLTFPCDYSLPGHKTSCISPVCPLVFLKSVFTCGHFPLSMSLYTLTTALLLSDFTSQTLGLHR